MLSQEEINQRLIKLRNYERLYPELKARYEQAQEEIKSLKNGFSLVKKELADQKALNQKLQLQIEELQRMVFGKRRKQKDNDPDDDGGNTNGSSEPQPRSNSSFRRLRPEESEVTATIPNQITSCPACSTPLIRIKDIIRYIEDIILPHGLLNVLKSVQKLIITTGYCPNCKKRVSACPISKQDVSLGPNVCQFIAFANTILRLSYDQTRSLLKAIANFTVSDGEISSILKKQALILRPEYEQLKLQIRGQPGQHYDETSWPVQKECYGNFAWVMAGTQTPDTIFLMGRSRGKGNALELKGDTNGVGITDDYGAYRRIFKVHQLCWAHPLRKLRDLARSDILDQEHFVHCRNTYQTFKKLYRELNEIIHRPFNINERTSAHKYFEQNILSFSQPHPNDPEKLAAIKMKLCFNVDHYLTCLWYDDIPSNNNKAEQALRHIVLKRKVSYGSKTDQGAETLAILNSTLLSLWWRKPDNFFDEYAKIAAPR